MNKSSAYFENFRTRLADKAATYVAIGDSVTEGSMEYEVVDRERVYHQVFGRLVERRYPHLSVTVINAGLGGETIVQSRSRWESDLFRYQPDLVSIGYGLNDAHAGRDGLGVYTQTLHDLIQQVKLRLKADILLLTPGMMIKRDNPNVHPNHRTLLPHFLQTFEAGYLPLYREAVLKVAGGENVACLDIYGLWEELEASGVDIHTRLANGINHPDREFHEMIAQKMEEMVFGK